jgi:hypothetical protein
MKNLLAVVTLGFLMFAVGFSTRAQTLGTYGDTIVVPTPSSPTPAPSVPDVWQLTSSTTSGVGYSGVYLQFTGPLTVDDLTNLSADYLFTQGTAVGGAPRFSIIDTTNNTYNEAYIYFTNPDPGTWENTGNFVSTATVYSNGFGGYGDGNTGVSWATFLANVGSTDIGYISLDLDAGFAGDQGLDVANFDVNGSVYNAPAPTPEPATLLLYFTGLVGMVWLVRRRQRLVS